MQSKQPFARRILWAFVLMTALVSGLFSLGIVAVVHFIEESLVSDQLSRQLDSVLEDDLAQGKLPRLDAMTRFFSTAADQYAIPEVWRSLPEGFSEVVMEGAAFYVYSRIQRGQRYMLVQAQQAFEAREQVLFDVVLAGFICTLMGAWVLGWVLAKKIMAPVTRLAQQVRHRDQLHPLAPPLAADYPLDEVGQLASAFDSTLGHIRQSLERERLFTSDVSHELRTPLMVIESSCELLAEALLSPQNRAQLERIQRASQDMNGLVQTFLQLARGSNNSNMPIVRTSLAELAEIQARFWAPYIQEKGVRFSLIQEAQHSQQYNSILLGSVLSNLLRNALHYTEQGAIRLVLTATGVCVEDSGTGITQKQQARLFEPFVRGTTARGEGLGLGLSLVKRICAHQGWQIKLDSTDAGSTFTVTLKSVE